MITALLSLPYGPGWMLKIQHPTSDQRVPIYKPVIGNSRPAPLAVRFASRMMKRSGTRRSPAKRMGAPFRRCVGGNLAGVQIGTSGDRRK
jgi:hypothetical protein